MARVKRGVAAHARHKKVLELAVKLGGESFSDYRKPDGTKGDFDTERKVYKREGQKCHRCGTKIMRFHFGGRSAFYCRWFEKEGGRRSFLGRSDDCCFLDKNSNKLRPDAGNNQDVPACRAGSFREEE